MTTNPTDGMDIEDMERAAETATQILRRRIDEMEQAKESQPERLAKARSDAEEARGWSLIEQPWDQFVSAIPTHDATGQRTGDSLALPNITAKETFGARLAFDMLDCGDDFDRIDEVQNRYFAMVNGDPGLMFLLAMSALSSITSVVVPQMLDDLEQQGSNYDARVLLAQARQKAWAARVNDLKDLHLETDVKPVDGYDIGTTALDSDESR